MDLIFKTGSGSGWSMYEGMVVTIKPAAGDLTVSAIDTTTPYHFHTTAAGNAAAADWSNEFDFAYDSKDAGIGVTVGTRSSRSPASCRTLFGGELTPRQKSDFVVGP